MLALGGLGFTLTAVPLGWGAALVFVTGLGLLEVAATTRAQQLVPEGLRGRVIGALMGVNALGLTLDAALVLLAALWPPALRAQRPPSRQA